jgi:hypothetical protein
MKKTPKKLTLSRETVRFLTDRSLEKVAGGTVWSDCYCTNNSQCCSAECGTSLCW